MEIRNKRLQICIDSAVKNQIKKYSELFCMSDSQLCFFGLIGFFRLLDETANEMYDDLGIPESKLPEKIHPNSKGLSYIKGISILKSALSSLPISRTKDLIESIEKARNGMRKKQEEDFDKFSKIT